MTFNVMLFELHPPTQRKNFEKSGLKLEIHQKCVCVCVYTARCGGDQRKGRPEFEIFPRRYGLGSEGDGRRKKVLKKYL